MAPVTDGVAAVGTVDDAEDNVPGTAAACCCCISFI